MELDGIILSEICQSEKEKHLLSQSFGEHKKIVKLNKGERRKMSGKYQKGRQNIKDS